MLPLAALDLVVLVVYVVGVLVVGLALGGRSRHTAHFTRAGGNLAGWVVGLSLFGTYLSSNTFLGVPGKAYGTNWNSFVFSLSLPLAALVAVRWFVPFYRREGHISAYHHLESRFGVWARTYAVVGYLLTQFSRMGSILFGVALALSPLTGLRPAPIILATGAVVTLYTLLGGISAVIWTDVVQSVVLFAGAVLVVAMVLVGMPEGPTQAVAVASEAGKLSLGSFGPEVGASTFWVVLLYGVFINLNNFGIDQSFVQRYHTARSDKQAARSVLWAASLYLPVSLLFFFLVSSLFSYYRTHPGLLAELETSLAQEGGMSELAQPSAAAIGDRVLPHFIATQLPPGVAGLLVAAIFAAAMSSVDTSLNSSATVILSDLYKRYLRPQAGERESMRVLRVSTLAMGVCGTGVAVAMIGVQSVLDAWWTLSGIFAGGVLGLFFLGMISRRAGPRAARVGILGVVVGWVVIGWLTFSPRLPPDLASWRSPFHSNLIVVLGTLSIFITGWMVIWWMRRRSPGQVEPAG